MSTVTARYDAVWNGPAGRIGLRIADDLVTAVDRLPPGPDRKPADALATEAVRQLRAWFDDPRLGFALPLAPAPTPFQRRFRTALMAVPAGSVVTYGELARRLGTAPRAVGAACGANPLPILVPCHRVVGANGIGGYGHDVDGSPAVEFKRYLLTLEGVRVD